MLYYEGLLSFIALTIVGNNIDATYQYTKDMPQNAVPVNTSLGLNEKAVMTNATQTNRNGNKNTIARILIFLIGNLC